MMGNNEHPMPAEWGWFYAFDSGEVFHGGPYATREDAIAEASGDGAGEYERPDGSWWERFMIAECLPSHIDLARWFEADDWIERLVENRMSDEDGANEDGDHPLTDLTAEDVQKLQDAVRAAIRQWQKDNGLKLRTWYFKEMRNEETIDRPAERKTK